VYTSKSNEKLTGRASPALANVLGPGYPVARFMK
jgi:hypothetical protein